MERQGQYYNQMTFVISLWTINSQSVTYTQVVFVMSYKTYNKNNQIVIEKLLIHSLLLKCIRRPVVC